MFYGLICTISISEPECIINMKCNSTIHESPWKFHQKPWLILLLSSLCKIPSLLIKTFLTQDIHVCFLFISSPTLEKSRAPLSTLEEYLCPGLLRDHLYMKGDLKGQTTFFSWPSDQQLNNLLPWNTCPVGKKTDVVRLTHMPASASNSVALFLNGASLGEIPTSWIHTPASMSLPHLCIFNLVCC